MASPITIFIIPNSGLKIKVDGEFDTESVNSNKPFKYTITNQEELPILPDARGKTFSGFMAPVSGVSLPPAVKDLAGVPEKASFFAFLHPPAALVDAVDWEEWDKCSTRTDGLRKMNVNADKADSKSLIKWDLKNPNKWAMAGIARMGAYAYFDKECKLLSINVISLKETDFDLRLSGPFKLTSEAMKHMRRSNRAQPLTLDFFHEAGFVASAPIRPMEVFNCQSAVDHIEFKEINHGGFAFFRDDGSALAYMIENSGFIDPAGDVTSLADAFQSEVGDFFKDSSIGLTVTCVSNTLKKTCDDINRIVNFSNGRAEYIKSLDDKKTLIHKACESNCTFEVIESLLEEEVGNLCHKDNVLGWTPLMYACRYKPTDEKLILLLIQKCPEAVLKKDRFNRSALHIACDSMASVTIVRALVEADTSGTVICQPTKILERLPIHIACNRETGEDVIKCLLNADKNLDTIYKKTRAGRLPLHMAIEKKLPTEVIKVLLDKNPNPQASDGAVEVGLRRTESTISCQYDGAIPLQIACWNNCPAATVKLLLEMDESGTTVRQSIDESSWLVSNSDLLDSEDRKERVLTKKDDNVSTSTLDTSGSWRSKFETNMVALHLAAEHGVKEVIDLLLEKERMHSSDPEQTPTVRLRDFKGRCPIHIACKSKNASPEVVHQLLEADHTKETTQYTDELEKYTAIHYACDRQDAKPEILQQLLTAEERYIAKKIRNGERIKRMVRTLDDRGQTPLYLAVQCGAPVETIEVLLQPENFYLKGFNHRLISSLANISAKNPKIQQCIIEKLTERCYFSLLFFDIYANTCALVFFLIGSEKMLNGQSLTVEPFMISICLIVFIFRTSIELKSQPAHFLTDLWNWCQILFIILLSLTVSSMIDNMNGVSGINRNIFTATCAFLVANFTLFLKATFLPFARFVGGLIMIFNTLVPFFIVSGLLLLAFAYGFRMSGGHDDDCSSMLRCYGWTLQGFFSGSDQTSDLLDILFGIIAIVVLLNVLIAIVSEAWESAADKANNLFWKFRLQFLCEARFLSTLYDKLCILKGGLFGNLDKFFDSFSDVRFVDKTQWTKMPYSLVQRKKQYDHPEKFFSPNDAEKIMKSHSLQADLYWTKRDNKRKERDFWEGKMVTFAAIAKWTMRCFIYSILLTVGFVSAGWTWPRCLRRSVLAVGLSKSTEATEEKKC